MVTLATTLTPEMDFSTWLDSIRVHWKPAQRELVRRAGVLAVNADPLLTHQGLALADIVVDLRLDVEVVAAVLLYPLLEAQRISLEQIACQCDPEIARLLESLGALSVIGELHRERQHEGQQLESLRKMLLAMAQDLRVVLIRLVLRIHEMRELKNRPEDEQRQVALETQDIFAPLANRLGIGRIKWELEDLTLRYLEPEAYKQLARALDERRADRERYINAVMEQLRTELKRVGLPQADVSGRVKHIYSIWKKMQRKRLPFEEIFDVRAVRIMVHNVAECYAALGVVHGLWSHIRKEFDDYIANPKPNGYQSLHTAVVGPEGKTLEVQIRTFEMHQGAELGVAAHWRYKEGGASHSSALERQIAWLRQMLEWKEEDAENGDFIDRFKSEALSDRVYVLTPKGQILELAQGSTPLDFAYQVHTELGHRCRGAKVNGRIVPLNYELKSSDQVEILAGKQAAPSRDWLSLHLGYLKSARARGKVRNWFKQLDLEKNLAAGRSALERECQRLELPFKQIDWNKIADKFNYNRPEELYAGLGSGDITLQQVLNRVQEQMLDASGRANSAASFLPVISRREEESDGSVRIRGVGKLLTQVAPCCKPIPPEPITGFITRGRGVTIHRQDCANLAHLTGRHPERLIEVSWGEKDSRYLVDIVVEAYDRSGLIRDISSILTNDKINVTAMNTMTDARDGIARMNITLEIYDIGQLARVLDRIAQLPNVLKAQRRG